MADQDEGTVRFAVEEDGIAALTLDRPRALNAINLAMRDQLWTWLELVRDNPDIRAVAVFGTGERAFCAGADITEFGTAPSYLAARNARRERDIWGLWATLDTPFVAALHGWTLGAGLELALLCDVRIAADNARLGLPEVRLGYIPSAGGTQTLPRTAPLGIARAMIHTGEPIVAADALRWGIIHRVVPRERLEREALAAARALAALPRDALRLAREALRIAQDLPLAQALHIEALLARRALRACPDATTLARWRP
jgi:enoyl-CoA hydratase/carnithine racemase